jgi:XTP/dITP diphosphohydrolase
MKQLIFASNNAHKAHEIRALLNNSFDIITLKEAGIFIDIPEPHATLEENASEKSLTIYKLTNKDCFSEDSGLEVEALAGEPGVKSARYAGEKASAEENNALLLKKMENISNRNAQFKTAISLIMDGKEMMFEGVCEGSIALQPSGNGGFGYDPLFIPKGYDKTFAELGIEVKSLISHRKKAIASMNQFLKNAVEAK